MASEARVADAKDFIKGATGDWEITIVLEFGSTMRVLSGARAQISD